MSQQDCIFRDGFYLRMRVKKKKKSDYGRECMYSLSKSMGDAAEELEKRQKCFGHWATCIHPAMVVPPHNVVVRSLAANTVLLDLVVSVLCWLSLACRMLFYISGAKVHMHLLS